MDIVNVDETINDQLQKDYRAQKGGFVQVGEKKWFYPIRYRKLAAQFKNFEVRPDDIWITGYPRSGTTLTEELVWLLTHNLDFDKSKEVSLSSRVIFFELDMLLNENTEKEQKFPEVLNTCKRGRNHLNKLNEDKQRRVIKTHLPFELLPPDILKKGCKVIYVCRYPKDVCVSYYLLQKQNQFMDFGAGFEKYWRYFLEGKRYQKLFDEIV
ncbi:sulfotransferase 1C4-like isoform X2 [Harmonia axyridis]|uniref:sulfotransferase 1C4-like isoform X2 n=1 Tax=Harmonia axyridis TaxID=115357 RepID=UPI001E279A10|nr:sulfotransferase 1C4-like isoform X2 [Harmonia axyridis]